MPEAAVPAAVAPAAGPAPETPAAQLQLVKEQLRRSPYALLVIDSVMAWLLIDSGASPSIVVWVLASAALQFARARDIRRMAFTEPARVGGQMRRLELWFFAIGLTRVWPIALAFGSQLRDAEHVVTMIMVGLAAGGVGTAAGMVRAYLAWAVPMALALMIGWATRGTGEGYWIAALLVIMFALLTSNVRSFGATLEQLRQQIDRANNERDRAEAAQSRAHSERQRAETAVQAKTRFFAAASHDLRQPLGAMRWYGDAIAVHAQRLGHEPLQAIAEGIGRALEHAQPLVGKYLDIARLEAGAFELAPTTLAMPALLAQVRDAYAHDAQTRALTLELQVDAPEAELQVVSDQGVLRSILDNLVGNALKFTPAGHVRMQVGRVQGPAGPLVRVAVHDSGIGIPVAEQERVFEDFYQLGNPDRSVSRGLGLGLSIVRRQAALLGTDVRLRSVPGQGSSFEFDLPAAPGAESESGARPGAAMLGAAGPALRVLVIDDEPEVRQALQTMLQALEWPVRTAAGLEDALRLLQAGWQPDALVLDHRLRGPHNGLQVLNELRQQAGCRAPAVIVTGDTSPEQLRSLRDSGLLVLHKPVQGEQLVATLRGAVEAAA